MFVAKYRHNHIAARGYLKAWSCDDLVTCHFVDGRRQDLPIAHVAVRSGFYVEARPDGTRSTAVEEAMNPVETNAIEILRTLEQRWPLERRERATIAEFLGLQALRGPAWKDRYEQLRDSTLDKQRASAGVHSEDLERFAEHAHTDAHRFRTMMAQLPKFSTMFGSMHWTLLRFRSPRLLTSDQPLAPVVFDPQQPRSTPAAMPSQGIINTVEWRFPVSPRLALICCWLDEPDDGPPRDGARHVMSNINFSVRAQADLQWFHLPGVSVPHPTAIYRPVSYELHRSYGSREVEHSERRRRVKAMIDEMIAAGGIPRKMSLLSVQRSAAA